jgi:hypothetical protein
LLRIVQIDYNELLCIRLLFLANEPRGAKKKSAEKKLSKREKKVKSYRELIIPRVEGVAS